jgi:hypothetical protein
MGYTPEGAGEKMFLIVYKNKKPPVKVGVVKAPNSQTGGFP